jgi:hypothetical protein
LDRNTKENGKKSHEVSFVIYLLLLLFKKIYCKEQWNRHRVFFSHIVSFISEEGMKEKKVQLINHGNAL